MQLLPFIDIGFLATPQDAVNAYASSYQPSLVLASLAIAVFAAFCALEMADRPMQRRRWVAWGSVMLGAGVWAMHFIGMVAFRLECAVSYDPWITGLSMLPGILASAVALHAASRERLGFWGLLFAGTVMGAGIGLMHYSGMAAIRLDGVLRYDAALFMLSLVAAVGLATVALWTKRRLRASRLGQSPLLSSLLGALVLGLAISGMHYIAMEAAYFIPAGSQPAVVATSPVVLASVVGLATLLLLGGGLAFMVLVTRVTAARLFSQAILQTTQQGFLLVDGAGRIAECNRSLEAMLGRPAHELVDRPLSDIPELVELSLTDHLKAEIHLQTASGQRVPCLVDGGLVPGSDTRAPWRFALFTDISMRLAAEEAMRQARDMAEAAAETKANFLANMSHEIRTPMNAIIGMSHLAIEENQSPALNEYLRKIQRSGQHLLGIINDILDVSKIEAGHMTVEAVDFDLEQVLDNLATLISENADAKGLELVFRVDPQVPTFMIGDPMRLGQVLINYANNAIKFTERGEIRIEVTVREQTAGDMLLHFAVSDTGIGLTPEQCSRLFQSFQQADASTSRKFGGTGLGLSICRSLAGLMGGEVGVDSTYGQGSTFWFTARLGKSARASRSLLPQVDLRGCRLLVVDDSQSARDVMTELLRSMTFVVQAVESGAQAVAAVREADQRGQPFAAVLLDWQMPGMDGLETARRIGGLDLVQRPRLLMVTMHGRPDLLRQIRSVGIDDVIVKPVTASSLFDSLMGVLGGHPEAAARDPAARPAAELGPEQLAQLRGLRVLLAEDNPLNQEVATALLRKVGMEVDVAGDGAAAVKYLEAGPACDVVLMDMQMPVMDGLEATRAIRALPGQAQLPILAMTANAMQADRDACLAAGMNDYIGKPIDPGDLFRKLQKWVRPRSTEVPEAKVASVAEPADEEGNALPVAEGLDALAGVERMLGDRDLYLQLMRHFIATEGDMCSRIEVALTAGDMAQARMLTHTLKGEAATLGADVVRQHAAELERALLSGQGREAVAALLATLSAELQALMAQVRPQLAPEPATGTVPDAA